MNRLVVDEDSLSGIITQSSAALLKSSSRKQKELRTECESMPKRATDDEKARETSGNVDEEGKADDYFMLYYHALDTTASSSKTLVQALDAIQRLMIKGYLLGRSKVPAKSYPSRSSNQSVNSESGRLLINVVVDCVAECASYRDAQVQLSAIKCLLTALHSVNTAVHDQALMAAVIGLWSAYLQPSDEVVRVTAKAVLAQCVQLVFTRMEHHGKTLRQLEDTYVAFVKYAWTANGVDVTPLPSPDGKKGRCGVCCACASAADHYCSQTADPVCGMPCKMKNLMNKDPDMTKNQKLRESNQTNLISYERDAYLIFRALLKIANKPLPTLPNTDAAPLDSKILSFHLLLSVLNHSGPVFRSSTPFVMLVKNDLVACVLKNSSSSSNDSLFSLASSIFVAIIAHFKPYLHSVIGSVIGETYLPYLSSSSASFDHRFISLTVISKICADPQTLVELFLNYDCDLDSYNTFQKIAAALERTCQMQGNTANPNEEKQIRELALTALVACMKVLVHWTKRRTAILAGEQASEDGKSKTSSGDDAEDDVLSPTGADVDRNASSSPTPSSFTDKFQAQRQQKLHFDTGVFKFNSKPKAGLKYLQDHGLLENDPASIAHFFHTCAGLNKTQIGDFMGDENAFNKSILYAYVEQMDFREMGFDDALRHFVAGFRLPGEAQKIDRMMEKFAEQYHAHNPGVFAIADTAYVLAFSVIMLNVDAHSPNIKKRMTKEEFFKNCRGIDDGKDVNPEFLGLIYDRITTNEIKLKDDAGTSGGGDMKRSTSLGPKLRQTATAPDSDQVNPALSALSATIAGSSVSNVPDSDAVVSAMHERNQSGVGSERPFYIATDTDCEVIKPMFEILWYPALATFSMILEESDHEQWITLGLDGYRLAIKVSTELELDTARLAFVSSLRKFTALGSSKEMKGKNLQAVKVLLNVAHQDGNRLKESWIDILQCISEVERLHLIGNVKADVMRDADANGNGRIRESDSANSLAVHRVDPAAIDRVFTGSANLDERAIIDFSMALRQIGEVELRDVSNPRVFCMQKIVEVTSYNMGRIRLVWNRVWAILSEFFVKAGCHPNLQVSIFAIDSVRQLAVKFLEKDELASFQFQKLFFKPFETIMQNNASTDTRELIVQCLQRLIASRANNIKSGWKTVFVVLGIAAKQDHQVLVQSAFDLLAHIMDTYFTLVTESSADTLDECVNCLVAFGCNSHTDTACRAIERLQTVADFIALTVQQTAGAAAAAPARKLSAEQRASESSVDGEVKHAVAHPSSVSSSSAASIRVWFLLLTGLSRLVGDSRLEVRNQALQALFAVLNKHGALFAAGTWRHIFHGVLFPIFDDVKHDSEGPNGQHVLLSRSSQTPAAASLPVSPKSATGRPSIVDASWLETTCYQALVTLVELFHRFYPNVRFLLPELLSLISSCVVAESEDLARIGMKCLVVLCSMCGDLFSVDAWWLVLDSTNDTLQRLMPYALISPETRTAIGMDGANGTVAAPVTAPAVVPAAEGTTAPAAVAAPAAPVVPALPFSSVAVALRCRSHLMLLDSLQEIVIKYFPRRPETESTQPTEPSSGAEQSGEDQPAFIDPFHSPTHTMEQTSSNSKFTFESTSSLPELDVSADLPGIERSLPRGSQSSRPVDRRVYGRLSCQQLLFVLDILHASIGFTHAFNADIKLRKRLYECGFLLTAQTNRLPQLFALEAHAIKISLNILFALQHKGIQHKVQFEDEPDVTKISSQTSSSDSAWRDNETDQFDILCSVGRVRSLSLAYSLLTSYARKVEASQLSSLEGSDGYMVAIFDQLGAMQIDELKKLLKRFYIPLTDLAQYAQTDAIRAATRRFLQGPIKTMLQIEA